VAVNAGFGCILGSLTVGHWMGILVTLASVAEDYLKPSAILLLCYCQCLTLLVGWHALMILHQQIWKILPLSDISPMWNQPT